MPPPPKKKRIVGKHRIRWKDQFKSVLNVGIGLWNRQAGGSSLLVSAVCQLHNKQGLHDVCRVGNGSREIEPMTTKRAMHVACTGEKIYARRVRWRNPKEAWLPGDSSVRSTVRALTDYTGCNRRNGPDFGRVFLMSNYTEKPQNTFFQS